MFTSMARTVAAFANPGFLTLGLIYGFGFPVTSWLAIVLLFFVIPILFGLGLGFIAAALDSYRHKRNADRMVEVLLGQIQNRRAANAAETLNTFEPPTSQPVN